MIKQLCLLLLLLGVGENAFAQAIHTADRAADLQIGVSGSGALPDYLPEKWRGYGAYLDFDVKHHLGLEVNMHHLTGPDPILYEQTYNFGVRYTRPMGPQHHLVPYAKAMYGRGIFNFAGTDATTGKSVQIANLGFNTFTVGAGLDLRTSVPGLNIRVLDYEWERWPGFPPCGLSPQILSFGVAYHFHGKLGERK
ncbi:hypothetical protein SAMN05421770_10838 [Granulicella rosea]|uniref:Outer membrane protein beta-barrel domain-containing protein n=1 Tax=Granulicella rosea TaxID=474952 RepID=A0A239LX33_9BACT|nr:hypothetical protein [Granulicella rosea]SNT34925.1 hypothetical protein SAMN05421770_10838 [Granulicella rosea]